MACRIPILRFEQYCSTEATIGFVMCVVATFARFFSFLMLTSSSRTCSCLQKVPRISVFPLLYCFHLIHHRIVHFSSIQCCPDMNRRFRFRSVVPNLCHRFSQGKFPLDEYGFTRLTRWGRPLAKCFAPSAKSNLSWANECSPCCVNLVPSQTPSSAFRLIKPVLRLRVSVLVYSLSRSSSSNQKVSLNLWIQVFSPVVQCVFGFEYRCVWIHHHPTNTQSHPALPFFTSWFGFVEQCCVVFASTQCRIRLSKFGVVFSTRPGQM